LQKYGIIIAAQSLYWGLWQFFSRRSDGTEKDATPEGKAEQIAESGALVD